MRSSLDTNILLYASNADCVEHPAALAVVEQALDEPAEWVVADQVLFEWYKALRNPRILARPLGAVEATARVRFLREQTGIRRCAYRLDLAGRVLAELEQVLFPYQRTHDVLLAVTLRAYGVERFYTRNTRDFETAGFLELINPID